MVEYRGAPTPVSPKDPSAVLEYKVDWSPWLGTDTIVSSAWTVPAGITQDSATFGSAGTTIWLSGGIAGEVYTIANNITTAAGRTVERSMTVAVRDL